MGESDDQLPFPGADRAPDGPARHAGHPSGQHTDDDEEEAAG
jgi:hypothetical protein